MSDLEILSKLAPGTLNPLAVFGGIPELTQSDVAFCLKGVGPIGTELAYIKGVGDLSRVHSLWAYWFEHLMTLGWSEGDGKVKQIADITLVEQIASNRCPRCNGTRGVMFDNKWLECDSCLGTGYRYPNHDLTGKWDDRLHEARRVLRDIEFETASMIALRLDRGAGV